MRELTLKAETERLQEVLEFIDGQLEAIECPMKAQMQIDVAVEELFVNIANYAYPGGSGDVTVQLETRQEPPAVSITLIDRGVPYDPLARPDPDVTLSAAERQIGGLGIFLVKQYMDDVAYEYRDGQNILCVTKKLG